MNSVIQALFFSQRFRLEVLGINHEQYIEKAGAKEAAPDPGKPAATNKWLHYFQSPLMQLQKVFALLIKGTRPYIMPAGFRSTLPDYFKKSFMQQDASEFFKVLSDLLERDAKMVAVSPGDNVFSRNFENRMRVKIQCKECGTISSKLEQFVDFFVPISEPDKTV